MLKFRPPFPHKQSGFTLVELVVVISLLGIIALASTGFIARSVEGYSDLARRDGMAGTARVAVDRIVREVRNALPNSARTASDASGECLEFIPVLEATQYVTAPVITAANSMTMIPFASQPDELGRAAIFPITTAAVYQLGSPSAISPVITTPAADLDGAAIVTMSFASSHQFPAESPAKRVFVVDDPVSYCLVGDRLYRYTGYARSASQPTPGSGLPSSEPNRALLASPITKDEIQAFDVIEATLVRNAIVMMDFSVKQNNLSGNTESLRIQQEVQIRNAP